MSTCSGTHFIFTKSYATDENGFNFDINYELSASFLAKNNLSLMKKL